MSMIVITGARGYIGRAVAAKLAGDGHALRLVSRSPEVPRYAAAWGANVEHCVAELGVLEDWSRLLDGADAVVHLSSRTDLRAAEADPAEDRIINVEPIRSLVRAAERLKSAIHVIFASSTSIVGAQHANPVNEQTGDRPCSVYDRHKLECEIVLRDATRRGILRACSLRLPTVYGYGAGVASTNSNRGILNMMLKRASVGEPLTIFGDGSYIRDYIHVDDVVAAICLGIFEDMVCDGRHYVIGTGRGFTLTEAFGFVAQEAYRATGRVVEIHHVPEPADLHPIERSNFVGDSSLFQKLTGWRPTVQLQSGIHDYFQRSSVQSQSVGIS